MRNLGSPFSRDLYLHIRPLTYVGGKIICIKSAKGTRKRPPDFRNLHKGRSAYGVRMVSFGILDLFSLVTVPLTQPIITIVCFWDNPLRLSVDVTYTLTLIEQKYGTRWIDPIGLLTELFSPLDWGLATAASHDQRPYVPSRECQK